MALIAHNHVPTRKMGRRRIFSGVRARLGFMRNGDLANVLPSRSRTPSPTRNQESPSSGLSPRPRKSPRIASQDEQRLLHAFVEAGQAGIMDELYRGAQNLLKGKTNSGAGDHRGHVPSDLCNFYVWRDYQQEDHPDFLCHVPQHAVPPVPVTLLYKPFANFTSNLNGPIEDKDLSFARKFWDGLHDPEYVTDHRRKVHLLTKSMIASYLGWTPQPYAKLLGGAEIDGLLVKRMVPAVIWEWKAQSGNAGDPYFEGLDYVRRAAAEVFDNYQTYALVVNVEGRLLHVVAASLEADNRVWGEPLAVTACYGGFESLKMTARIWKAIRLFVEEWESLPRSQLPPTPWLLKQNTMIQRPFASKLFFTYVNPAGQVEAAKFVSTYSEAAHRAWGRYAPELRGVDVAGAGWMMVRMEYLDSQAGWKSADEVVSKNRDDKQHVAKLAALIAGAADAGHSQGFVHGDLRLCNLLLRSGRVEEDGLPSYEVRLVDFDWAGEEGVAVYPRNLNPKVNWAPGAAFGVAITKQHDIHFVENLLQQEKHHGEEASGGSVRGVGLPGVQPVI